TGFQDVLEFGRRTGHENRHIHGWSPDSSSWNDQLYPAWKSGDPRWENCWRGGKVVALLTSDSPALIGSNVTFAVNLRFPRCQKETEDGDIVYQRGCANVISMCITGPNGYRSVMKETAVFPTSFQMEDHFLTTMTGDAITSSTSSKHWVGIVMGYIC
ncbi:hypothetical protein AB205_0112020, partial [Aquarana catesbeiana]